MFTFTLFNVGHGFCAYATTPGGSNLLFDCGYDEELEFYPSRYFADRKIQKIYGLALSHFDRIMSPIFRPFAKPLLSA